MAKAGTTSLHDYLRQHPGLYLPFGKELHYFDAGDEEFRTGLEDYLQHFRGAGDRPSGEATPSYFRNVDPVAPRMRELYEESPPRFLLLFRDPVRRAYSHYLHNLSEGREASSFRSALAAEREDPDRSRAEWKAYFGDGLYAETLEAWREHFPADRFLILLSSELRERTDAALREAFRFLGVDPSVEIDTDRRLNRTGERSSRLLGRLLAPLPFSLPSLVRRWAPRRLRLLVDQLVRRLSTGNGSDRPSLDPELERELRERYAPHVRRLEEMIDRDLSDWLPAGRGVR